MGIRCNDMGQAQLHHPTGACHGRLPQISGQAHGRDLRQAAGFNKRIKDFNLKPAIPILGHKNAFPVRQLWRYALSVLLKYDRFYQNSLKIMVCERFLSPLKSPKGAP